MNVPEVLQCLLALLLSFCDGQLVVNMKNKGGEVLRESIQVVLLLFFTFYLLDPGKHNFGIIADLDYAVTDSPISYH